jgi:hypothetical protein
MNGESERGRKGGMEEKTGKKNISSSLSFVIRWTDLGAGRRLGCELSEGGDSHGGLVDATELVLH